MALTTCPDCEHKISTQAAWCVRCGSPRPVMPHWAKRIERAVNHGVIVLFFAPVIYGVIFRILVALAIM